MTQVFAKDGVRTPVTLIEAGPCVVLQVKHADAADKYDAIQIGYGDVKPHRSTLPEIGHCRKAQTAPKAFVREVRLSEPAGKEVGDLITVDIFSENDVKYVDVTGVTKGRGFQGGMRRWGFGGQPASHGTERKHRAPGSISSRASNAGTGRPKKGRKMAGRMGGARCTTRCQALVGVDPEHNLLLVKGSVPGPNGTFVFVRKSKTRS
jgi:large subunit ribosomal protein L3